MPWGVGQAESRLCVCVGEGEQSERPGRKGWGDLGEENRVAVWVGEGRGGGTSRLLRTKPRKQEARGEGPGRSP